MPSTALSHARGLKRGATILVRSVVAIHARSSVTSTFSTRIGFFPAVIQCRTYLAGKLKTSPQSAAQQLSRWSCLAVTMRLSLPVISMWPLRITNARLIAELTYHAGISASVYAWSAIFVTIRRPSVLTMVSASRDVVENIRLVLMYAKPTVMVKNPALRVRPLVMSAVVTQNASKSAMNRALLAQRRNVCLPVHIAHAPCLAPHHAIMYRALSAARKSWPVAINVRLFVERAALTHASARLAEAKRSRTTKLISFWVNYTETSI